MDDAEKQEWLNRARGYILYFMAIAGVTVVKIMKERMKKKKLSFRQVVFIAVASLFFGNIAGVACYAMNMNIVWTLCISNFVALSSESIIETFDTKSKGTMNVLWDAAVDWVLSWIKKSKKK